MEHFDYEFPMSAVMLGSSIPGPRIPMEVKKIASYLDGSDHPLIRNREQQADVLARPEGPKGQNIMKMHGEHTPAHGFMNKLKELLGPKPPAMKEGYERLEENRDWRLRG